MARYGLDNPKKADFLDWLLDPIPTIPSMQAWGELNNVNPATLRSWKRDPKFRRSWEKELAKRNIDPGRTQKVIDAMWSKASDGDTTAAKLYLEYVGRFAPPPDLEQVEDVSELSDEELDRLIAEEAGREAGRRRGEG